jgi:hypothetical protein
VAKSDIDIMILFNDTIKAIQDIFAFENTNKSFIKNSLFGWATVPDPNITLCLMILDFNQNWVPIAQRSCARTHNYSVVYLLGVMIHEIGHIE